MYPGLTHGAADVISSFGLPEDRARFLPPMVEGRFAGTMCSRSRTRAPTSGATKTRAKHLEGNVYKITGTKCWISAGDHDLGREHRPPRAGPHRGRAARHQGLSLFIVPKIWVNEDGSLGQAERRPDRLDRAQARHPRLGDGRPELRRERQLPRHPGRRQAAHGHEADVPHDERGADRGRRAGLSVASAAYLNALSYARERLQGSSVRHFKDPNAPRVPIIEHSDVRRMLLEMKAKVEGMRTLCIKLALHADLAHALHAVDESKAISSRRVRSIC